MINSNLIIVTPVYEDSDSFYMLAKKLSHNFNNCVLVIVNDGSLNDVIDINKCPNNIEIHLLHLARNVGHQKAIATGLLYLHDKIKQTSNVVIMDSDGEDRPESVIELLEGLKDENIDVAVALRKSRVETIKFKFFYQVYRIIFKFLTGKKINFGNFMALKYNALKRLVTYDSLLNHLAGTLILSKLRLSSVAINRGPRYAGQSKMNFSGLVLHGLRAIMIFSDYVLIRLGLTSVFSIILIFSIVLLTITLKAFGMATPGWFSIILGMLFLIAIQITAFVLIFLVASNNSSNSSFEHKNFLQDLVDSIEIKKPIN